jgi:ABC-2 type transport system ATP-binding protein
MLRVDGLVKSFGRVKAVRDVSFSLDGGRITAMLGENGAGKTTTIRMVLGFLRKDAGRVFLGTARIGYVPEHPEFFPWLSGAEVLALTACAAGLEPRRLLAGVRALCEQVLLDPALLARRPATYSSGNAKKLAYLQSLAAGPELLIVDEPFAALDPPSIRRMRDLFGEMRKAGAAVLLSSHMLAEMDRVADDFLIMRKGQVAARSGLQEYRSRFLPGAAPDLEAIFMSLARS